MVYKGGGGITQTIPIYVTQGQLIKVLKGEEVVASVFAPHGLTRLSPKVERKQFPKEWCYSPRKDGKVRIYKNGWVQDGLGMKRINL
ncbi:hypothetical protein PP175_28525 (plasmid) [Aneurinibacillus sp. Ricciae_BoGa-3]|uniref:hypothetical protein n=1 Tax=Aneurinibacillus sp. Ricciae_BoGa-3 TaxID=3022697 RepID=UPI002340CE56|nr:hypothetical protein [Aneurinibacillus sp. Ricciae_BoGa-3]WCK57137.1 hypothetical protein PP175_28525 [Aneurinibacillus sp. Ricciae_BoGa-3]